MPTVYKIGVEMTLAGGLAQGLTAIAGQLAGIEGKIGKIEKAFGGWGNALGAVGAVLATGMIVKGLDEIFDSTRKLNDQIVMLKEMGATPGDLSRLHQEALDINHLIPGTTEAGVTSLYGQIRSIFARKPEEAYSILPNLATFAQTMANNAALSGHDMSADEANKIAYQSIRSADLTGQMTDAEGNIDVDKLQRFLDIINKVAIGTHQNIGPQDWLNIAKQGGIALRGFTDQGLITAGIVSQAMGANRFGTAEMSLFQQMAGGTMFKRNAEAMERIGLLKPGEWGVSGGRVILHDEASKRLMSEIQNDPLAFVQLFKQKLAAQGITDPQDQIRELYQVYGRQTTQREIGDILVNMNQMLAERSAIANMMGSNPANQLQNTDSITIALNNLSASFTNLKTAIGGSEGENIAHAINDITGAVNLAADYFRKVNVGAIVVDIVKGPFGNGLTDLGNALKNLTGIPFDKAVAGIHGVTDAIGNLLSAVGSGLGKLGHIFGGGGNHTDMLGNPETSPIQKQSFIAPANSSRPVVVHTALNVDGRALAESVADQMNDLYEMPGTAPSPDGWARFQSPDYNISST